MKKGKAKQEPVIRTLKYLSLALLALATFAAAVPQGRLPESLRNNRLVAGVYNTRAKAENRWQEWQAAGTEPAAGTATSPGAGYADKDRARLEALISKGAED